MPTCRRLVSESGYYHVMARGNNKSKIFDSEADKTKMLKYIRRIADSHEVSVLAYCIMPNHYHLLVYDNAMEMGLDGAATADADVKAADADADVGMMAPQNPDGATNPIIRVLGVSHAMHRLNTAYSHSYMGRHEHVGHVFQGRFRSKRIDSVDYLSSVVRYIHQNPVKACIAKTAADYRFSSYGEYIGRNRFGILSASGAELMKELGFSSLGAFQDYHIGQDESSMQADFEKFEDEADLADLELTHAMEMKAAMPSMDTLDPIERLDFAMHLMANTSKLSKRKIAEIANISRAQLNNRPRRQVETSEIGAWWMLWLGGLEQSEGRG